MSNPPPPSNNQVEDQFQNYLTKLNNNRFSDKFVNKILKFVKSFLTDIFLVFPLYFIMSIQNTFHEMRQQHQFGQLDFKLGLKMIGATILDILLPFSIMVLSYICFIGIGNSEGEEVYYVWCKSCFMFFVSFILLHNYLFVFMVQSDQPYQCQVEYILRDEHIKTLGLGTIKSLVLNNMDFKHMRSSYGGMSSMPTQEIKKNPLQSKHDFAQLTKNYATQQKIDLTMFYYALIDESLSPQQQQNMEDSVEHQQTPTSKGRKIILEQMRSMGFEGKRLGSDDILFPIYKNASEVLRKEEGNTMIILIIVFLQIIMPIYLISLHFLNFHFLPIASISGFYIYIILLLYKILDNEDLQKRQNIMAAVSDMVDFQLEDEKKEDDDEEKKSSAPNQSQQTYGIDLNNQIDITCPISLETWDNCRRIALILDREKSQKFEVSYIFLCIYLFFLIVILGSIFSDVYLIIPRASVYTHPIIVYNFFIDSLMILAMFMIRIYHSQLFNQAFMIQSETLEATVSLYEDLLTLMDYYFDPNIQIKLENPLYNTCIELIQKQGRNRLVNKKSDVQMTQGELRTSIQYQIQICLKSVKKIQNQITRDQDTLKHQFLGILDLDFDTVVSSSLIGLATVLPVIFQHLGRIFSYKPPTK